MNLKWQLIAHPEQSQVKRLSQEGSYPETISQILLSRGFSTKTEAEKFLNPQLSELLDPFLLPNVEKAASRISQALKKKEKIMIFGDYDVDGITATALLYLVLNRLGAEVSYYLPNRLKEGYGLSQEGIKEAFKRGVVLIITVDCGISAYQEASYAKSLGIDLIITDHHQAEERLPEAESIINPKITDYAGGELSGVGVAFKLAQGIYKKLEQDPAELYRHLDLAALGSSADIVPLVKENRILVKFGLEQLMKTSKPGLKALIFISGLLGKEIGTGQVVFILAPRLNAAGRLGDAENAIKLLTTRDETIAAQMARILDQENRRRQGINEAILEEALELIEQNVDLASTKAIVLSSPSWHQGVIGIVASRLVEIFNRPAVMIAVEGEQGKGSARSIPGFHLYEALKECQDFLIRFGGHEYAAGLLIHKDNIEKFKVRLNEISIQKLTEQDLEPKLWIDAAITFDQIDERLIHFMEKLAPFGPQNMRPVFMSRDVKVSGMASIVGDNHLRLKISQNGQIFSAVGFGQGSWARTLSIQNPLFDIAFVIEKNIYNGKENIQLRLKDLKIRNSF